MNASQRKAVTVAAGTFARPLTRTTGAAYSDQRWIRGDFQSYVCLGSRDVARDSKVITFTTHTPTSSLGAGVISGVKVRQTIQNLDLEKSYSPTSHPEAQGSFDLLVKSYPMRHGGGLGAWLCTLKSGDTACMKIKPQRQVLGSPIRPNRWRHIGALVGGTGVAPLLNLITTVLNNPNESTTISLIASHATEADAHCLDELEAIAASRHDFRLLTTFTRSPPLVKSSGRTTGRIDATKAMALLPPPSDPEIIIFVCGSDGFVEAMAGPVTRVRDPTTGAKHKVQGPTLGLLGDLGYGPHQVMKL